MEVLAACGFESGTPGPGEHSFTNCLIHELADAVRLRTPIPVTTLHRNILCRLRAWKPALLLRDEDSVALDGRGRPLFESAQRRTPIYCNLTNSAKLRSIVLCPRRREQNHVASGAEPEHLSSDAQRGPTVLLAIRVQEDSLKLEEWTEWLRDAPPGVREVEVRISSVSSLSTLLLLQVPIPVWDMLPRSPATSFVGFTTGNDFIRVIPCLSKIEGPVKGTIAEGIGKGDTGASLSDPLPMAAVNTGSSATLNQHLSNSEDLDTMLDTIDEVLPQIFRERRISGDRSASASILDEVLHKIEQMSRAEVELPALWSNYVCDRFIIRIFRD